MSFAPYSAELVNDSLIDPSLFLDVRLVANSPNLRCSQGSVKPGKFEGGLELATAAGLVSPAYYIFRGRNINPIFYYAYFRSAQFIERQITHFIVFLS